VELRVIAVLVLFPVVWSGVLLGLMPPIRTGRVRPVAGAAWFACGIAFLPMVPFVAGVTEFDPLVVILIAGPAALLAFVASRRLFHEAATQNRQ
jgi:hypothetical protein